MTAEVDPGTRARARYAPGFVAVAALACVPPALVAGPGGRTDVAFLLGAAALVAVGVTAQVIGDRFSVRWREVLGLAVLVAAGVLLVGLAARSVLPAHDFLGHLAALQVATAAVRRAGLRVAVQSAVLVAAAAMLLRDAPALTSVEPVTAVLGPLLLLVVVSVLASALASDHDRARVRAAAIARRAALRAELLGTVRSVAQADPRRAFDATIEGLLALGFDVAGVALVQGDELVPERVAGLAWTAPLPSDHPHSRRVLRATRPVVFPDYAGEPERIRGVAMGAVLAAPLRGDGRPLGMLVAGRREPGTPENADIEIVDVFASHLAAVLIAERTERRQRELLARLRELEALRESFVARVTDDLRDPLTVVRAIAQTLATHAERLGPQRRADLADRLADQAHGLGVTIEALLDFSRGTASPAGTPEVVDLIDLLAPPLRGAGVAIAGEARGAVVVDTVLVRRGIEVLRRAELDTDRPLELIEGEGEQEVAVVLPLRRLDSLGGGFARSVGEQLLVAGGAHVDREVDRVVVRLPRPDPAGRAAR